MVRSQNTYTRKHSFFSFARKNGFFSIKRKTFFGRVVTVWKFKIFAATQILREINFDKRLPFFMQKYAKTYNIFRAFEIVKSFLNSLFSLFLQKNLSGRKIRYFFSVMYYKKRPLFQCCHLSTFFSCPKPKN